MEGPKKHIRDGKIPPITAITIHPDGSTELAATTAIATIPSTPPTPAPINAPWERGRGGGAVSREGDKITR